MANKDLQKAKAAQNNEFYTRYADIQSEVNAYLEYDPDVFRGKTVLLPCDDPEWSNFTLFFAKKFQDLGLRKLISTSYAPNVKTRKYGALFSYAVDHDDATPDNEKGRIFVIDRDVDGDGRIDYNDIEWKYLKGDGDFRSDEVKRLRDEADIIVTNPPFSLFREFFAWVMEAGKKFLCICNKNCLKFKEVFPHIMGNDVWVGATSMSRDMLFDIPQHFVEGFVQSGKAGSKYKVVDGKVMGRSPSIWMTNLEHGHRHEPLQLMTMEENIKHSKHKDVRGVGYPKYINYDAINVPFTDAIPSDYDGVMGVPISFLGKYNPEQFEILGMSLDLGEMDIIRKRLGRNDGGPTFYIEKDGVPERLYDRIAIRHRHPMKRKR